MPVVHEVAIWHPMLRLPWLRHAGKAICTKLTTSNARGSIVVDVRRCGDALSMTAMTASAVQWRHVRAARAERTSVQRLHPLFSACRVEMRTDRVGAELCCPLVPNRVFDSLLIAVQLGRRGTETGYRRRCRCCESCGTLLRGLLCGCCDVLVIPFAVVARWRRITDVESHRE